jgi:hypothetical protein
MTSSAVSSDDLELRGMWLRMWSSSSLATRLLMAPRAVGEALEVVGAGFILIQGAQNGFELADDFVAAVDEVQFFARVCDIFVVYPIEVWSQCS